MIKMPIKAIMAAMLHEEEATSSMSDLEIDHNLTDSRGTLQELGKKYLLK